MGESMIDTRNVTHWRIGSSIDIFDIVSASDPGVMHCHATVNIGAVVEGHATIDWNGETHDQPQGSVILLNAFEAHASAWHAERNRYFVINIAEEAWMELCAMIAQGDDRLRLNGPISRDQLLFHAILGIRAELMAGTHRIDLNDIAGLLETLVRRDVLVEDDTPSHETIEEFRTRLGCLGDAEQGGSCKIEQIAQDLGLSRFQLSRLVRQSAGMQPRRLRLQLMVATAQYNIARGLSLSYAAMNAGFADQSHMNREFRRTLGMTPREYQRVHAKLPARDDLVARRRRTKLQELRPGM